MLNGTEIASAAAPAARHREAGKFLRSRRERLAPSDVGLPGGFRRRTPGLRREEVAMLAGIGTTWYTWMEQGRDVRPSDQVLTSLADALRLDWTERRHLFALHDRPAPAWRERKTEGVGEPLRRMLNSLTGQPAYVLGWRWDILAWNRAADVTFGPYARLDGDERNALHLLFVDPDHRCLLADWEELARASLAMFRADCVRRAGDPALDRLIVHLTRLSPEFSRWWPQRELAHPLTGVKRINHPNAGRMLFEYSSFGVDDPPDTKLVVFTPIDEEGSVEKLSKLLHGTGLAALREPVS
jgi:transcriptional regulator with XRE-family HTH domain